MPSTDVLENQNPFQEPLFYNPTPVMDENGNVINDIDVRFLLRVLINEVRALRVSIESLDNSI